MSNVDVVKEGRVLRVSLNRVSHRNVLSIEMAQALIDSIEGAQADEAIGAVLLEGCGEFFCYGSEPDLPEAIWTLADRLSKPLVAAVKGAALGAGMALVAQAHVSICAQGSSFGLFDIRNRVFPLALNAVAKAIGWRRATELALTSRACSTPEALQMGLISEVAPAFEYEQRAEAVSHLLSEADAQVVRRILSAQSHS